MPSDLSSVVHWILFLPLEIAGFLLLVALVGVVSLSKDNPENKA